jgi:hypothetical protein
MADSLEAIVAQPVSLRGVLAAFEAFYGPPRCATCSGGVGAADRKSAGAGREIYCVALQRVATEDAISASPMPVLNAA